MTEKANAIDVVVFVLVIMTIVMAFLVLDKYGYLEWMKTRRDAGSEIKVKCTCKVEK